MHLDVATALNIISTFAIVGALIFTGLQVREVNTARREQASVAMIVTTQSISVDLLSKLPENASITDIGLSSPETQRALFDFGVRLETIGYMVHQRMVRLDTVDDLMGGVTLVYWSRAKAWAEAERESGQGTLSFLSGVSGSPPRSPNDTIKAKIFQRIYAICTGESNNDATESIMLSGQWF